MLDKVEKKDESFFDQPLGKVIKGQQHNNTKRKHSQKYSAYCKKFHKNIKNLISAQCLQRLFNHKIQFRQANFVSDIQISFLNDKGVSKACSALVSISFFTLQITILSLDNNLLLSPVLKKIGHGAHGSIYLFNLSQENKFVIKSIRLSSNREQQTGNSDFFVPKILKNAIKEYCLAKIFSVIEIGPKILDSFGFDLLVYEDRVQFCMQECSPIKSIEKSELMEIVEICHQLRVIHGDIKGQNIMWSNRLKKNVLIDFGFCMTLDEKPGEMSLTHYFGTYDYCSPEMKDLLMKNTLGYVDLYYNDLYCLDRTIQKLKYETQILPVNQIFYDEKIHIFTNFQLNLKLIKLIFERETEKIVQFLKFHKSIKFLDELVNIVYNLPPQKKTYRILTILQDYQIFPDRSKYLGKNGHLNIIKYSLSAANIKSLHRETQMKTKIYGRVSFTWLMLFFLLFFEQDMTIRAKHRKYELRNQIQKSKQITIEFCYLLVQYTSNLYTTERNIIQILKYSNFLLQPNTKDKEIQDKQREEKRQDLYKAAYKIAIAIKQRYSINLLQIYQKVQEKKKKQIRNQNFNINYEAWVQWFQKELNEDGKIEFSDYIIYRKPVPSQTKIEWEAKNMVPRQLIVLEDHSSRKKIIEDENSFYSLCQKFYLTSKCCLKYQKSMIEQIDAFLERDFQTYLLYRKKKAQVSINRCFKSTIMLDLSLLKQIQMQIIAPSSIPEMARHIQRLKAFLSGLRCPQTAQSMVGWVSNKISRIRNFELFYHKQLLYYWVRKMNQILEDALSIYVEKKDLLLPNIVYQIIQLHFYSRDYLNQMDVGRNLEYFLSNKVWEDCCIQKHSNSQKIFYFYSKILVIDRLQFHQRTKIISDLKQICLQPKGLNEIKLIHAHILIFQFAFSIYSFGDCIQHLRKVKDLTIRLTHGQGQEYYEIFTIDPLIQKFFSLQPLQNFDRYFEFVNSGLLLFNKMRSFENERQCELVIFLREMTSHYLIVNNLPKFLDMLLNQYRELKKQSYEDYIRTFGNSICIFQMVISAVISLKLLENLKNQISLLMKIAFQLVSFSSVFIKKSFNIKFSMFTLTFIQKEIIKVEKQRKIICYRNRQFRNTQFPLCKSKITQIIRKTTFKKEKRNHSQRIIEEKLYYWNENKRKVPPLASINLRSTYKAIFQLLLSQNSCFI